VPNRMDVFTKLVTKPTFPIIRNVPEPEMEVKGKREEAEYFKFVKGKRLIIVGPAEYLVGQNRGEEFDKFDIIIRMNLSCPTPAEKMADLGHRTDVLYHIIFGGQHLEARPDLFKWHTKAEVQSWKDEGVRWVVLKRGMNSKRIQRFATVIEDMIPWVTIPLYQQRKVESQIGTNPNMMPAIIGQLLRSEMKSLKVVGCDFHTTGYHAGYGGFTEEQGKAGAGSVQGWGQVEQPDPRKRGGIHNIQKQTAYLRRVAWDKRLDLSEVFERTDRK